MSVSTNNAIPFVPENTIDPAAGLNEAINTIDALLQLAVLTVNSNTPPASPVAGDRHVVGTDPNGLWTGQAGKVARFLDGFWSFFSARYALNLADGVLYGRVSTTWSSVGGSSAPAWGSITGTLSAQADLAAALDLKVDKVTGLQLSQESYTSAEKEKLASLTANPMTSIRDLIVGGTGGAPTRLAGPTSEGLVLTRVGNALAWAIATGFANPMTVGGDMIIGGTNGAATRLAGGAAGQVLTMVAGAPAWVTPSGGGGGGDFKADGSVPMTGAITLAAEKDLNIVSGTTAYNLAAIKSNSIRVTGAGYLDSLGAAPAGTSRTLRFSPSGTLIVSDASYTQMPGTGDVTVAEGDTAEFVALDSNGTWKCLWYQRANGQALVASTGFTEAQVRATPLTGLPATSGDVTETDSVLSGIGKLQASKVAKESGKGLSANDYTTTEKNKLAGIAEGAQVNSVTSVAGRTGAVTLAKGDVGLSNVDNTADSAKPVSVAQQAALDAKANLSGATFGGAVGATGSMMVSAAGASIFPSNSLYRARGTIDAPTGVLQNDKIGEFAFQAVGSDGVVTTALSMEGFTTEAHGPSGRGIQVNFATVRTGQTGRSVAFNIGGDGRLTASGGIATPAGISTMLGGPMRLGPYTLTTLPSAAAWPNYLIIVTNAAGGSKVCWSNGTNWCLLNTTTTVS